MRVWECCQLEIKLHYLRIQCELINYLYLAYDLVEVSLTTVIKMVWCLSFSGFLPGPFLDPEDGSDMLLRYVCSLHQTTRRYIRKYWPVHLSHLNNDAHILAT
jgi:hypothetical protein